MTPREDTAVAPDIVKLAYQFQSIMAQKLTVDADGEILGVGPASFAMARAYLATLPQPCPGVAVKVLPLEWNEEISDYWWVSDFYKIERGSDTIFGLRTFTPNGFHPSVLIGRYLSLEAAQSAAQADYTARILSALAPAAQASPDMVLVPRIPTREMTMAGCQFLPSVEGVTGQAGRLSANVYRAMVEAALITQVPSAGGGK